MHQAKAPSPEEVQRLLKMYRKKGWSVIPIRPSDKAPLIPWKKYQTRPPTKGEIQQWLESYEQCNWAKITGQASNTIVLDCDTAQAVKFAQEQGLPSTPSVKTGRGVHYHFKYQLGIPSKQGLFRHIDLCSDGHYVVIPPSLHENGSAYRWIVAPDEQQLAALPEWVRAALTRNGLSDVPSTDLYCRVKEGCRNETLTRLAGVWIKLGLPHAECIASMWNDAWCDPPLTHDEVRHTIESIWRAEQRKTIDPDIMWIPKCQWVEK
jgi:hypothetical protein